MPKAIIIGAGVAGIASAIRLRIKGYDVQVFESNNHPGGKLSVININGYRFDAGPSLFTMPQYVDELFLLAGKNPRQYFNYTKLEVVCNYFYEDGTMISAFSDQEKLAGEIAAKTSDTTESVNRFLKNSARIYSITNHVFLEKSLHKLSTYLNWNTIKSIFQLGKIDSLRTMALANKSFFNDKRTQQFFNRYATYNGSNPYKAPATLNVIPHLEQHYGAYFPDGGMYAITLSLVKLAEEIGVRFNFSSPVEKIEYSNDKVTGVVVGGKTLPADIIVSNMDVWFTYKRLLRNVIAPEKMLKQERSSSALIFYWGISRQFPVLDLHNIFFSNDYEKEFNSIWQEQTVDEDPTIYVNISSKFKPDDAPPGCENWFVMINVPSNSGQDWDDLIAVSRRHIIAKLSRMLNVNLESLITCEEILDPRSIEEKTSSYQGSLYGTSSNNLFAAFLRHANFSSQIKGLYFAGGSVHPGGGIPLALLSAKIVSDLIN
ncbi:phytoene desaturase [Pedobacter sp. HMF7647]|uniref:Phytoene desaturase n=1 Tax=Hufsiella arboris TaxID=2695275 RepID=A0A7K1Y946_9SPHI|nr:1-hydroxycarotenoid 3,4-desaturase CrtD [Hufsiella arboris]MXV51112.1 phytoene desaturase [Hufsiella arboris]